MACVTQSVVRQYDSSCKRMRNVLSVITKTTKNISQHSLNIHVMLHNENSPHGRILDMLKSIRSAVYCERILVEKSEA